MEPIIRKAVVQVYKKFFSSQRGPNLHQKGLSAIGVLIAAAVLTLISLGFVTSMHNTTAFRRNIQAQGGFSQFEAVIRGIVATQVTALVKAILPSPAPLPTFDPAQFQFPGISKVEVIGRLAGPLPLIPALKGTPSTDISSARTRCNQAFVVDPTKSSLYLCVLFTFSGTNVPFSGRNFVAPVSYDAPVFAEVLYTLQNSETGARIAFNAMNGADKAKYGGIIYYTIYWQDVNGSSYLSEKRSGTMYELFQ